MNPNILHKFFHINLFPAQIQFHPHKYLQDHILFPAGHFCMLLLNHYWSTMFWVIFLAGAPSRKYKHILHFDVWRKDLCRSNFRWFYHVSCRRKLEKAQNYYVKILKEIKYIQHVEQFVVRLIPNHDLDIFPSAPISSHSYDHLFHLQHTLADTNFISTT